MVATLATFRLSQTISSFRCHLVALDRGEALSQKLFVRGVRFQELENLGRFSGGVG